MAKKRKQQIMQANMFNGQFMTVDEDGVVTLSSMHEADVEVVEDARPNWYTVSEITGYIQGVLENDPVLGGTVVVRGEVSNAKISSRGHLYFTLKDGSSGLSGVMWASIARHLPFDLEDGLEVFVTGKIEIYAPSGTYSIVARKIEPVGVGALQLAFEQLKARLDAEGLFSPEYKKPLPDFPRRIGIVTARTGAVIHDMLRVIRQKNPNINVLLAPVAVQGAGAAQEIAAAVRELNRPEYGLDVLIVARGGGSFEDLFCFSEEPVVRAIFASQVPVVTGIGHEPDFSLADAVADYSAATPTMAAETAVPDWEELKAEFVSRYRELTEWMSRYLSFYRQETEQRGEQLMSSHRQKLRLAEQSQTYRQSCLLNVFKHYFQTREQTLARMAGELQAFSPLSTLARGYSMATRPDGAILTSVQQAQPGDPLILRLSDGKLQCEVIQHAP